jgi:hypothetical protein
MYSTRKALRGAGRAFAGNRENQSRATSGVTAVALFGALGSHKFVVSPLSAAASRENIATCHIGRLSCPSYKVTNKSGRT